MFKITAKTNGHDRKSQLSYEIIKPATMTLIRLEAVLLVMLGNVKLNC